VGDLRSLEVEGVVLGAVPAITCDPNFAVSVIFAVGATAIADKVPDQSKCDTLAAFFERSEGEELPESLADAGVTACLTGAKARELASWMRKVDEQSFIDEVEDMFGQESVARYVEMRDALCRLFESAFAQACDVCILSRD
jgi:hypothetical protein